MESAAGFAREQGVSPERVRTLAAEHGLGEKVGGVWAFDEDDVEALEELLEEEDDDPDDEEEDDE